MNTIFSGQLFLIDKDRERAQIFKDKLEDINQSIFFNHFPSVSEAFNMVLNNDVIAPEFIYVHASLADFQAKDILKKLRMINKTKTARVVVFGSGITDAITAASLKYSFKIIKTFPDSNLFECNLFEANFVGCERAVKCSSLCKCC